MRDAFGGAFMIKLFLVFIFIYVSFTAIALNYAKAFKVKNKVIEYIEANEITDISKMSSVSYNEMKDYFEHELLGNMNYKANINCSTNDYYGVVEYCSDGIRIERFTPGKKDANKLGVYYKVSTSVGWTIPFINKLLNLSGSDGDVSRGAWIVSGETRTIVSEGDKS